MVARCLPLKHPARRRKIPCFLRVYAFILKGFADNFGKECTIPPTLILRPYYYEPGRRSEAQTKTHMP